jgi:hypothetical protein
MFLSAFARVNADPAARAHYDKQRAHGKMPTQALLRLTRRRISVLFAMLRDGTFYEPRTAVTLAARIRPMLSKTTAWPWRRTWRHPRTKARPEVVAVYGRGLGLATVTMDRASLAGHVTSGFDNTLLVRGGSAKSLTALGKVTDASGYATEQSVDAKLGAWSNNMMAAVLGGFAAIAAVNTLVMTVLDRRRELGTLRLIGSTRSQVLQMLRWEALLVSAVGVVLGSAIAAATLIPMMHGLTGEAPYVPPMLYGSFAAGAGCLALLAVTLPARAALRRWS